MMGIDLLLLLTSLVVAAGAAVQTATGMGMALVAAPLLALLDPALVPGPLLVSVVVLSAVVALYDRGAVDREVLGPPLLGVLVGSVIGGLLLWLISGVGQPRVVGGLILAAVAISVLCSTRRRPIRTGRLAWFAGGTASGLLGALAGAHGPPIALVLPHGEIRSFRATICAFFTLACSLTLGVLAVAHRFDGPGVLHGLALVPAPSSASPAGGPSSARSIAARMSTGTCHASSGRYRPSARCCCWPARP
jgi:hypothetical protein